MKKGVGKQKFLKGRDMLDKGVGTLKVEGSCDPLQTMFTPNLSMRFEKKTMWLNQKIKSQTKI